MSKANRPLANPILSIQEAQSELTALRDERSMFLLSYIYMSTPSPTYRRLRRELSWDLATLIEICLGLQGLGLVRLGHAHDENSTLISMTDRGVALLRLLDFPEPKVNVQVERWTED